MEQEPVVLIAKMIAHRVVTGRLGSPPGEKEVAANGLMVAESDPG